MEQLQNIDNVDKEELSKLLKNIAIFLKTNSVKDLNSLIRKGFAIESTTLGVIQAVARVFKKTPRLIINSEARGVIQEARMVLYAVLHYDMKQSKRSIARKVVCKNHNAVNQALKLFDDLEPDKFKRDKDIMDRYNEVKEIIKDNIVK